MIKDKYESIVVSDIGETLVLANTQQVNSRGTILYMAPERLKKTIIPSNESDVWSGGVVIYELAHLKLPFNSSDEILNLKNIEFNNSEISQKLKPILTK